MTRDRCRSCWRGTSRLCCWAAITGQRGRSLDLHGFLGLSQDVRPGYRDVSVRYRVDADAPREQPVELCDYAQRTSPVLDVLIQPVPVSVSLVD
ncbi:MAG: hypothetical protein WD273_01630 [Trueperaceae bacterium]